MCQECLGGTLWGKTLALTSWETPRTDTFGWHSSKNSGLVVLALRGQVSGPPSPYGLTHTVARSNHDPKLDTFPANPLGPLLGCVPLGAGYCQVRGGPHIHHNWEEKIPGATNSVGSAASVSAAV